MKTPVLYRKRFIPSECVRLKDDTILECTDSIIVTKWDSLKARCDFSHGYSCYYLHRGYKVSKFLRSDGSLLCWYCDIVDFDYDESQNILTVVDLLADVKIFPNGLIKVVDLDELSDAYEQRLISEPLLKKSLLSLNRLLNEIYDNGIESLISPIEKHEQ